MQFQIIITKTCLAAVLLWFSVSPASGQTLFGAIGDYGDGSGDEGDVAGLVGGWNPDFVISLGDNRYGSTNFDQTVGQFYCNLLANAGSGSYCSGGESPFNAFFPSLGNHDYYDGNGLNEYLNYFTLPGAGVTGSGTSGSERYYDFIMGPVHFFVVDSEGALISNSDRTAQMNWLQARLAGSSSPWQVVYFHHPPYSSAMHGSTPGMQWPFAAWGADAVLSGHDHSYERISADGIVYFVNGLGGRSLYTFNSPVPGSQVRYNSDYGAMRINASDTAITFEFISTSGNVIDSYTLQAAANAAPHAAFSSSCTNLSCDFIDSSTDSDGSVTGWSWDFGDGSHSSTPHPSHSYNAAGNYNVSLSVTDNDGTSDATSHAVSVSAPVHVHDLAIVSIKAPKKVPLTTAKPTKVKIIRVTIQNRSSYDEYIQDLTTLAGLISLSVIPESVGSDCQAPVPVLRAGKPQPKLPVTLKPKKKLKVIFDVTYTCAVDPMKGTGHEDYHYVASVDPSALDGWEDANPASDVCPRPPVPGGTDAHSVGSIHDRGCGGKNPDRTLGAAVLSDVVAK
jgi:tartrate-resistant acid phosphatase type 5